MTGLYTASYADFRLSLGVLVSITLYPPRFRMRYEVKHHIAELAPKRDYFRASPAEFDRRYLEQLEQVGVKALAERFAEISAAEGRRDVVLLCYEKGAVTEAECHRRLFARFWEEHTGEYVEEIGGPDEVQW